MDIQNLKVFIPERDLQTLAEEFQPKEAPVKDLAVRVTAEGVKASGEVATPMMPLSFESVWRPSGVQGRLAVQLVELKAGGFPATLFRSVAMGLLKDAVNEPFLQVLDDGLLVDVQEFVRR